MPRCIDCVNGVNIILYVDMAGNEGYDPDDISKMKNNTIIGDHDNNDDYDREQQLRGMLKGMINLPGATPMNTQMDEDRD